jgi:hypothetical protein
MTSPSFANRHPHNTSLIGQKYSKQMGRDSNCMLNDGEGRISVSDSFQRLLLPYEVESCHDANQAICQHSSAFTANSWFQTLLQAYHSSVHYWPHVHDPSAVKYGPINVLKSDKLALPAEGKLFNLLLPDEDLCLHFMISHLLARSLPTIP